MPAELRRMILDPNIKKIAHNAAFEIAICVHVLGIPATPDQWECTMVMALSVALPASLEILVRDALKLDKKYHKDKEGERLMRLFSYPNHKAYPHTHPEEFERYIGYGAQDVVAEKKVHQILKRYVVNPSRLFHDWCVDQKVNRTGWPVDIPFAKKLLRMADTVKARYLEQLQGMTGLEKPGAWQQLLPWAQARGYPFSGMAKGRVKIALSDFKFEMSNDLIKVLKLRLISNKTSLSKVSVFIRYAVEGRMYQLLQFLGAARTGRWSGRGPQIHNLMRPTKAVEKFLAQLRQMIDDFDLDSIEFFFGSPLEALASSIRSIIKAKKGRKLVVADLSAIELCVATWLTGSKFWWKVLNEGLDPYKSFGVHFLGKPYDQLTKQERNDSKPGALGSWYRLGGGRVKGVYPDQEKTGLWGYAESLGVYLTKEQSHAAVKTFRRLTPEAEIMWNQLDDACMECIQTHQPQRVGPLVIDMRSPFMRIRLPSGRYLFYCRPRIELKTMKVEDPETGLERDWTKNTITFEQMEQTIHKWVRIPTHGGTLFENVVQAIAADVLKDGIENAVEAGFDVVGHVHDEIITEVDDDPFGLGLSDLIACMVAKRGWSETIPLKAAGYENSFYKKD